MRVGCIEIAILLIVLGVPTTIVALFVYGARKTARAQAAEATARRERGERITDLICDLAIDSSSPQAQQELFRSLREAPVGFAPELTEKHGWFDRVVGVLHRLAKSESGSKAVVAYFRCFAFPAGQQAKVLDFLARLLTDAGADSKRLILFTTVAANVLAYSSAEEARWLYDRVLAAVRMHRGDPALKTAAVTVGRLAYSVGRPNRQPTVYDEQAIANDIAAQLP